MSSYLVLARKYRSKQFADIVGQGPIVRTLMNAIRLKRTHHAYIFSGSRGIGKTSIARIFAKTLRCPNLIEKEGILYTCDDCSDCKDIAAGTSMDVLEIDGASNNSVDNIREIRETARFMPTSGDKKIYIIDEVHMLSGAAFNALLKTLEEPPEHVIFIFATTEAHKIPETILGRCQRFDFQRMTVAQIVDRLKYVLASEGISYEESALIAIARAAEGSMRDSLSILDQVISFSGMNVTLSAVRDSVGMIGQERITELVRAIFSRNPQDALQIAEQVFDQGVNLRELLSSVIETLHALLLIRVGVAPKTTMTAEEIAQLKGFSNLRSVEEIETLFQMFHFSLDFVANSPQPKLLLDTLLIKAAVAEQLVRVGDSGGVEGAGGTKEAAKESGRAFGAASVGISSKASAAPIAAEPLPVQPVAEKIIERNVEVKSPVLQAAKSGAPFSSWEAFVAAAFDKIPVVGIVLERAVSGVLPTADQKLLRVVFKTTDKGDAERLQQKGNKDALSAFLKNAFGFPVNVECVATASEGESLSEREERMRNEKKQQRTAAALNHPIIQEAKSLFGVELTSLEVDE